MNTLNQLQTMTVVVADTGNLASIAKYKPQDATTNPSLLLKVAQDPNYAVFLDEARRESKDADDAVDIFNVKVGIEILKIISGRVSTEVDARLSFDTTGTIAKARKLVDMYSSEGIPKERILIKIASTWEGIQAAKQLQAEGINCNLTLLFSFAQAVACAEAKVFLISPFVGRILDWYKTKDPQQKFPAEQDPGVVSVANIYHYYKQHDYKTIVMGASFRNIGQIIALAGCDYLTISPPLLDELYQSSTVLEEKLTPANNQIIQKKIHISEAKFRLMMNQDAMATEKLAEGIRGFITDQEKLINLIIK